MSAADVLPRKVWTRADLALIDPVLAGTLELVSGEVIDTMGRLPPHTFWKNELRDWLQNAFGNQYVRSEDPIDVSPEDNPTSEPEPDLAVTSRTRREMRVANPSPRELRLVVEVSDSTFYLDTRIKADLYARAAIPEYWVVDIRDQFAPVLIVHRNPADGKYGDVEKHTHTETVSVLDQRSIRLQDFQEAGAADILED